MMSFFNSSFGPTGPTKGGEERGLPFRGWPLLPARLPSAGRPFPLVFWKAEEEPTKHKAQGCPCCSATPMEKLHLWCHASKLIVRHNPLPEQVQMRYIFAKQIENGRSFWDAGLFLGFSSVSSCFPASLLSTDRSYSSDPRPLLFSSPCPANDWLRHGQGSMG